MPENMGYDKAFQGGKSPAPTAEPSKVGDYEPGAGKSPSPIDADVAVIHDYGMQYGRRRKQGN